MPLIEILSYTVNTSIDSICFDGEKRIVNTINPHSYCEAKKDGHYREALQKSNLLLPDGVGIVWAAKLLCGKKIEKIAGADLHQHLLTQLNQSGGKVFYMGSAPSTLQKIESKVNQEHPNVKMASYSPPYKADFSDEENQAIVNAINAFKPDVLFVGMTAPKQEKWSYEHKELLDTKIIASIGAVFDFYAGTIKRPGKFWQNMGLEWLPRLLREPKRLWRRNFVSTPHFMWDVLKAKMDWFS